MEIAKVKRPAHCVVKHHAFLRWCGRSRDLWHAETDWYGAECSLSQELERVLVRWRAEELWILHGRPIGRDEEFWLKAERQVRDPEPYMARVQTRAFEISQERPGAPPEENWDEAQRQVAH
jgi:hypothetical protein